MRGHPQRSTRHVFLVQDEQAVAVTTSMCGRRTDGKEMMCRRHRLFPRTHGFLRRVFSDRQGGESRPGVEDAVVCFAVVERGKGKGKGVESDECVARKVPRSIFEGMQRNRGSESKRRSVPGEKTTGHVVTNKLVKTYTKSTRGTEIREQLTSQPTMPVLLTGRQASTPSSLS